LGFLFLAVRGGFLLEPMEAFKTGNFQLKEEAKQWPLLCHIGHVSENFLQAWNSVLEDSSRKLEVVTR